MDRAPLLLFLLSVRNSWYSDNYLRAIAKRVLQVILVELSLILAIEIAFCGVLELRLGSQRSLGGSGSYLPLFP